MHPAPAMDGCTPRLRWTAAPRARDRRSQRPPCARAPPRACEFTSNRCDLDFRSKQENRNCSDCCGIGRNKKTTTVHAILWYPCGYDPHPHHINQEKCPRALKIEMYMGPKGSTRACSAPFSHEPGLE